MVIGLGAWDHLGIEMKLLKDLPIANYLYGLQTTGSTLDSIIIPKKGLKRQTLRPTSQSLRFFREEGESTFPIPFGMIFFKGRRNGPAEPSVPSSRFTSPCMRVLP